MPAIQLRDHIYSVGAADPDVRIFHGYETRFGTTYNCYLVQDGDKNILIDNVKEPFTEAFIANIEQIVPLEKIDLIIQNHIEPDHSGSLPAIAARVPGVPIYCTAGAKKGIDAYYGAEGFNCHVVKAGETLCTGKFTFHFLPAPMVHWPDSMLTYLAEEKILFSNDAFGQHVCMEDTLFDDQLGLDRLMERAADYYANIVLPFGSQVTRLLGQAAPLDIEMICPSHGVILKQYIAEIVEGYTKWSANEADENQVCIVYDTMWGATEQMMISIREEYEAQGKTVHVFSLKDTHCSAVMGTLLACKYVFIGASTLNRTVMPTVGAFLYYLKGLSPKNRIGMAFGSHGWSGESTGVVQGVMEELGWEILPARKLVYKGHA